ncbi:MULTISPECIES: hypothetical protein [Burkholderia]|uniref:hypothetical protein n=1 Tax=Burkholderia TaxID=32008 RepID=UPI001269F89B|nr:MULTISPECIES: hypothetical protein [Burkholderia]
MISHLAPRMRTQLTRPMKNNISDIQIEKSDTCLFDPKFAVVIFLAGDPELHEIKYCPAIQKTIRFNNGEIAAWRQSCDERRTVATRPFREPV